VSLSLPFILNSVFKDVDFKIEDTASLIEVALRGLQKTAASLATSLKELV
jgi:hypothetical protein